MKRTKIRGGARWRRVLGRAGLQEELGCSGQMRRCGAADLPPCPCHSSSSSFSQGCGGRSRRVGMILPQPGLPPGLAIITVMRVTTCLISLVIVLCWNKNIVFSLGFPFFFGAIEVLYFLVSIVCLWIPCISTIGVYSIIHWNPHMYRALSPCYMYKFLQKTQTGGWMSLGGILLCVTGSEAMYADLGHFSQSSIKISWLASR